MSLYSQHNSLTYVGPTNFLSGINGAYVECGYNVRLNTTISGVALLVQDAQYNLNHTLSNYEMKVNGENMGPPSCFFMYYDEYTYVLFWSMNKVLNNEYPVFEFHSRVSSSGTSWYLYTDDSSMLSPGWGNAKFHSSDALYDGKVDGVLIHYGSSYHSFQMSYWTSEMNVINETSPYPDLVTCPKTTYNTYDTVPLYYQVRDYTYVNTIQLWHNGSQMMTQGYPYSVPSGSFNGELSLVPLSIGTYQFRLVRNSITCSKFNITVTNPSDMSFILYVIPNPCDSNSPVLVGYRYFPSDGMDGFIGVSEFNTGMNLSDFSPLWVLSANTSGNYTFLTPINVYVSLYKKIGSSFLLERIIYLKVRGLFGNTINVAYPSVNLQTGGSFTQRIYGTQNINGFTVSVRVDNKIVGYVTDKTFYEVYVLVTKAGVHRADLCIETSNGSKVLASVNFTVSVSQGEQGDGGAFSPELKALFGICFVIVSVCVPLMISVKYHVNVPTFVYVIFMAFGIGLGTKLGFLDLWLVFLFVVALVAGAIYTIFGHGGPGPASGGGGDSGVSRTGLFRRRSSDYGNVSKKGDYGVNRSNGYLKGPGRRGY